eukprot:9743402-Alexandrium_andersonii.AAC.1
MCIRDRGHRRERLWGAAALPLPGPQAERRTANAPTNQAVPGKQGGPGGTRGGGMLKTQPQAS